MEGKAQAAGPGHQQMTSMHTSGCKGGFVLLSVGIQEESMNTETSIHLGVVGNPSALYQHKICLLLSHIVEDLGACGDNDIRSQNRK